MEAALCWPPREALIHALHPKGPTVPRSLIGILIAIILVIIIIQLV